MSAKMTGDLRERIRSMAAMVRPEWVAAYYGVPVEDVQGVIESQPDKAEIAAKAKRETATVEGIIAANPNLSADDIAALRASIAR
jgi:hypothetical protein